VSEPFLGEIRLFAGNFAPTNWSFCDGRLVSITSRAALFDLIGTTYGGDGRRTFALPDLRSRVPVHQGTASTSTPYVMGETAGAETVALAGNEIPSHRHPVVALPETGTGASPAGELLAGGTTVSRYSAKIAAAAMSPSSVGPVGGGQPHANVQPFVALNFIIALVGIFPSES
jgi:microcystin-dependent protein